MPKLSIPGNCAICSVWRRGLHRDHIVPKWKAKRDNWTEAAIENASNIQFICANCHEDKTRKDLLGKTHSVESRAKMSAALKGRPIDAARQDALVASHLGVPLSPERRANLIAANTGIVHSAERRAKVSASLKQHFAKRSTPEGIASARLEVERLERLVAELQPIKP
jgi:hypothetical protein